tara:strand:- start:8534 stop:9730 length:1197 start_codon:yes stop_codon:yes gene_type:complete
MPQEKIGSRGGLGFTKGDKESGDGKNALNDFFSKLEKLVTTVRGGRKLETPKHRNATPRNRHRPRRYLDDEVARASVEAFDRRDEKPEPKDSRSMEERMQDFMDEQNARLEAMELRSAPAGPARPVQPAAQDVQPRAVLPMPEDPIDFSPEAVDGPPLDLEGMAPLPRDTAPPLPPNIPAPEGPVEDALKGQNMPKLNLPPVGPGAAAGFNDKAVALGLTSAPQGPDMGATGGALGGSEFDAQTEVDKKIADMKAKEGLTGDNSEMMEVSQAIRDLQSNAQGPNADRAYQTLNRIFVNLGVSGLNAGQKIPELMASMAGRSLGAGSQRRFDQRLQRINVDKTQRELGPNGQRLIGQGPKGITAGNAGVANQFNLPGGLFNPMTSIAGGGSARRRAAKR